ncbi:hypothetical protein J2S13_000852 [Oikeobacillus pervagus]|uniref:Uncharacterized protein n=1 Tax=Oikeobacillus pervagus TaxID=1325931 RepID=A0AAJ1WJU7_9BACI|nr:hypothetical protein [Oikeobacillus pervagus]
MKGHSVVNVIMFPFEMPFLLMIHISSSRTILFTLITASFHVFIFQLPYSQLNMTHLDISDTNLPFIWNSSGKPFYKSIINYDWIGYW